MPLKINQSHIGAKMLKSYNMLIIIFFIFTENGLAKSPSLTAALKPKSSLENSL